MKQVLHSAHVMAYLEQKFRESFADIVTAKSPLPDIQDRLADDVAAFMTKEIFGADSGEKLSENYQKTISEKGSAD